MLRIIPSATPEIDVVPDERSLILAAQQGDTTAFKELYERYRDRVYNLIYYTMNREEGAEDILQTVFVKVYKALPCFRLESSFHTWVYRVALNECKNHRRGRKLFVSLSAFENEENHLKAVSTPFSHQAAEESDQRVRAEVLALSPKLREVVILKYLEELSYEEVATTLGCSIGTVASRLHRALLELEKRLRTDSKLSNSVEGGK